jgi:hypothetical protein
MEEVCSELQACLADLEAQDGGEAPMIVQPQAASKPARPRRQPRARRAFPVWPALFGVLLLAAVIVGIVLARDAGQDGSGGAQGGSGAQLAGVGSFDPQGDNEEHSERVTDATDGDPSTYWTTESYRAFSKPGVGLVLKATGTPGQIALSTDSPGFTAEIRAGSSAEGPFDRVVGQNKTVEASTVWDLEGDGAPFYVVWITALDRVAHVNEVKAS